MRAVAVDGSEKNFASAKIDALPCPRKRVAMGGLPAATDGDVPVIVSVFCIDGEDNSLGAEFAEKFRDKFGASDRCGIDGDFVGAGAYDRASIVEGADAAACGERNSKLGGDAANGFEKRGTAVAGSGDIEDDEFSLAPSAL